MDKHLQLTQVEKLTSKYSPRNGSPRQYGVCEHVVRGSICPHPLSCSYNHNLSSPHSRRSSLVLSHDWQETPSPANLIAFEKSTDLQISEWSEVGLRFVLGPGVLISEVLPSVEQLEILVSLDYVYLQNLLGYCQQKYGHLAKITETDGKVRLSCFDWIGREKILTELRKVEICSAHLSFSCDDAFCNLVEEGLRKVCKVYPALDPATEIYVESSSEKTPLSQVHRELERLTFSWEIDKLTPIFNAKIFSYDSAIGGRVLARINNWRKANFLIDNQRTLVPLGDQNKSILKLSWDSCLRVRLQKRNRECLEKDLSSYLSSVCFSKLKAAWNSAVRENSLPELEVKENYVVLRGGNAKVRSLYVEKINELNTPLLFSSDDGVFFRWAIKNLLVSASSLAPPPTFYFDLQEDCLLIYGQPSSSRKLLEYLQENLTEKYSLLSLRQPFVQILTVPVVAVTALTKNLRGREHMAWSGCEIILQTVEESRGVDRSKITFTAFEERDITNMVRYFFKLVEGIPDPDEKQILNSKCVVCNAPFVTESDYLQLRCSHLYCYSCLYRQVLRTSLPIRCFECSRAIPLEDIDHLPLLPYQWRKLQEKAFLFYFQENKSRAARCPRPGCWGSYSLDDPNPYFHCTSCFLVYCKNCRYIFGSGTVDHLGYSCKEFLAVRPGSRSFRPPTGRSLLGSTM